MKLLRPEIPPEGGGIPSEYVAVDGLISAVSGPYIDTGIDQTGDISIKVDYQSGALTTYNALFGSRKEWNDSNFGFMDYAQGGVYRTDYGTDRVDIQVPKRDNDRHVVEKINNVTKIDDTIVHTSTSELPTNPISMYLFAFNEGGANYRSVMTVYDFEIFKSGILVQKLVPVRRKSDSEYGMWDTVTEMFFGNSGSGKFSGGDDLFE